MTQKQTPELGDRKGDFSVDVLDLDHTATPERLAHLQNALTSLFYAVGATRVYSLPPVEGSALWLVAEGITPEMAAANPDAANPESAGDLADTVIAMVEACRLYMTGGYQREDFVPTPEQQAQLDELEALWTAEDVEAAGGELTDEQRALLAAYREQQAEEEDDDGAKA